MENQSKVDIQNASLCLLYALLLLAHSFTLTKKDFHRKLISIFSAALILQTLSTILVTIVESTSMFANESPTTTLPSPSESTSVQPKPNQIHHNYSHSRKLIIHNEVNSTIIPGANIYIIIGNWIDLTVVAFAQFLHIISINLLILFLLVVAKGWPITRRDMPFKYAFATFWIICLLADLINFHWNQIETLATLMCGDQTNILVRTSNITTFNTVGNILLQIGFPLQLNDTGSQLLNNTLSNETKPNNITLTSDGSDDGGGAGESTDPFHPTNRKLSLLIRAIIMIYFLLELRKTMVLEQEQRKLRFYLNFGASSMVWFVHSFIVYVISLRVNKWQGKLITGFSSVADFLAFAVVVRLLWPLNVRSYLFRKVVPNQEEGVNLTDKDCQNDNTINVNEVLKINEVGQGLDHEEYEGLQMRDLNVERGDDKS